MNRVSTGGATGADNPMLAQNSVSYVLRWYKGRVTHDIRQAMPSTPFAWQTRFHDHVVRNDTELHRIRDYIRHNPFNWRQDAEYFSA